MKIKSASLILLLISSVFAQSISQPKLLKESGHENKENHKNKIQLALIRKQISKSLKHCKYGQALWQLREFNDLAAYNSNELQDLMLWKENIEKQLPNVESCTPEQHQLTQLWRYRLNQFCKFIKESINGIAIANGCYGIFYGLMYDKSKFFREHVALLTGLGIIFPLLYRGSKIKNSEVIVKNRQKNINKFDEIISNRIAELKGKKSLADLA